MTLKCDPKRLPVPPLAPTRPVRQEEAVPWLNEKNIAESAENVRKVREKQPKKKPAHNPNGRQPWLWTPERDAVLVEMYRASKKNAEIADQFGMTPKQVNARVNKLRKPGGLLYGEPMRGRYLYWSDEHIERLIVMFNEGTPTKIIAAELGRSRGSIDTMIGELKQKGVIKGCRRRGKK